MEILIHQSISGELNKAWDLLRTSLPDLILAKKIAFKTDLQDSPPSGIIWSPTVRGFLFEDNFIITKTFPDNSPNVRKGRVFSHSLIISKQDLSKLPDLSKLFSLFTDEIDKSMQIESIIINSCQPKNIVLTDRLQQRFNKVIKCLVNLINEKGSIIWVGQKHFETAVCKLWELLSTSQKENLNFGIHFNPNEVPQNKLNFITIPDTLENKFDNKGFNIISRNDSATLTEFSEQYLAGEQSATTRLKFFIDSFEIATTGLITKDISTIAKGVPTYENLDTINDLKLLITLANIASKYSPEKNKGMDAKVKVIDKIYNLINTADEQEVFLLRNFPTGSFYESKNKLLKAVRMWCENKLFSLKNNLNYDYTPFINQIYSTLGNQWLLDSIKQNVKSFLSSINQNSVKIIWNWIAKDVKILKYISNFISNTTETEAFFLDNFNVSKSIREEIKAFALEKHWLRLYAITIKHQKDFATAISELLEVDTNENYFDALNIITSGVEPKEIINVSIANGNTRCIEISGRLCNTQPTLLKDIQIESYNWQKIFLSAIQKGNNLTDGLQDPKKIIYQMFNALIGDIPINESLLKKVSESEFANILDYPNRNDLWPKLPSDIKRNFLEKTTADMLERLSKNSAYEIPTDLELSNYIISYGISTFLYYNSNNIKTVLPIFNSFEQIPEYMIKDYLHNYSGKLDVVDATQLGKLINSRKYTNVASLINDRFYTNGNYKYTLAECYGLLSFVTRGMIMIGNKISNVTINVDEWWEAFNDLAIRLYSRGPTENEIWNQADGEDYDLLTKVTGKEAWLAALQKLKNGGCEGITVKKLLKVMLKEFPKNEELKTLKELWSRI